MAISSVNIGGELSILKKDIGDFVKRSRGYCV